MTASLTAKRLHSNANNPGNTINENGAPNV